MRRAIIFLAILLAFSTASVSIANASAPVIQAKTTSTSGWLSYYIAIFLRAHAGVTDGLQPGCGGGSGDMLRGDADDYANGRGDPLGPDTDDKSNRGFDNNGGRVIPAGTGTGKIKLSR